MQYPNRVLKLIHSQTEEEVLNHLRLKEDKRRVFYRRLEKASSLITPLLALLAIILLKRR